MSLGKPIQVFFFGLLLLCCGGETAGEGGRVSMGLTLPQAGPAEIRSVGLFALRVVPPEFICEQYLDGELDPVFDLQEHLLASVFVDVPEGEGEMTLSLDGITPGERSILAECYGAGGDRIFLGCGQTAISENEASELELEMVEDTREATDPQ